MAASESSGSRLGVLDGLRGIAVVLVLWYHAWEISWLSPWPWLTFVPATGFVGVHLFFFLSGFVIVYPFVLAETAGCSVQSWGEFAWRRFIKIVPSYGLSIAVAYALGYAQAQPNASLVPDLVSHALFIHTWFPLRYGTIDGVLWTLAVEVEFYALFPLLWWCFRRRPWLTAALMIGAAGLWRAALAGCCRQTLFAEWSENLPGYLDIFAFGMMSAYVYARYGGALRARLRLTGPLISIGGAAALIALLQNLYAWRAHDLWASLWQVDRRPLLGAAFAAIALGSLISPRGWQRLLDNLPLRFLAAISYNLYLYHQIVARELLAHHIPSYAGDPHRDARWKVHYTEAAFAISLAEAAFVTYVFEHPLLRLMPPQRGANRAET